MGLTLSLPPAGEDMLRFITCGSVDDGKSTLIGRLLFDAKVVPEDHLTALTRDGRHYRAFGDMPDLALLVDGLQAEREQGITIDVGYRFSRPRAADSSLPTRRGMSSTPAHGDRRIHRRSGGDPGRRDQGPAAADLSHSAIVALMGIQHVVLAVNKMDLVDYQEDRFAEIVAAYATMPSGSAWPRSRPSRSPPCLATMSSGRVRPCRGMAARRCSITWRTSAPGRAKADLSASRCSGSP